MKYKQWNRAASAPQARAAMEAAGVPPLAGDALADWNERLNRTCCEKSEERL